MNIHLRSTKQDSSLQTRGFSRRAIIVAIFVCFWLGSEGCHKKSHNIVPAPQYSTVTYVSPLEAEMLYAAGTGNAARVKELLDQGVDVNMRGADRNTPLMEAAYAGHIEAVRVLLEHGGDLSAKKSDGATPFTLASSKEIVALFNDVGALVIAADAGNDKIVNELIEKGTPVNALDRSGQSALHAACWTGKTETVKLLLAKGADPRIEKADGATPLSLAKGREHQDIVALLMGALSNEAGAAHGTPATK